MPINIEFGRCSSLNEPSIYWRTGDFSKNLLEVSMGKEKKELRTITLVACEKIYKDKDKQIHTRIVDRGCPILSLEYNAGSYVTNQKGEFRVVLGECDISIFFSDEDVVSCVKNKDIVFYLNARKQWIGLKVKNLTHDNQEVLFSLC